MSTHRTPAEVIEAERQRTEAGAAANDVDTDETGDRAEEGPRVRVADGAAPKPRAADVVARIAEEHADLWRGLDDVSFATIGPDGRRQHVRVYSSAFVAWLVRVTREHCGHSVGKRTIADAQIIIDGTCRYDREAFETHTRTARHEGDLWIDLGDETGEAVHVTANGWCIAPPARVPVRFVRPKSMRALPRPVAGGSIDELRPFLNTADEHGFTFAVAWLVAALRPGLPFPVAVLAGEQGVGKSTASRVLRSLVDPNSAPIRSAPKDEEALFVAAQNAHVLALDNLSGCPAWLSDGLCRIATGSGFAKRALYTDDEETIINVIRPIILNGIDDMLARSDLADRSLVIGLQVIPEADRREEDVFWRDFGAAAPRIFGALLSGASGALARIDTVQIDRLPRMADFARWATAAESALGLSGGAVMEAYRARRTSVMESVVEASPVGSAVRRLLTQEHRGGKWEGTAVALLAALGPVIGDERHASGWPKTASHMMRDLHRAKPALRTLGIDVQDGRTDRGRWVRIERGGRGTATDGD